MREDLQLLKERFDSANEQYEALREASERSVAHWVWTTAPRYELDPLFFFDHQTNVA